MYTVVMWKKTCLHVYIELASFIVIEFLLYILIELSYICKIIKPALHLIVRNRYMKITVR